MTKSPEYTYPQYPHAESFNSPLYLKGLVTEDVSRYPLAVRRQRAILLNEHRSSQKGVDREKVEEKIKNLREVNNQFTQQQKEMSVNLEGMGEMSARYVILNLNEAEAKPKSLIFLIPGISNDIEGSGMLGHRLALEGHRVVILSYPESWHGKTTEEFGTAVEEDQTFEPHTQFFQQMIENITAEERLDPNGIRGDLEIWGHSTGAVIAAKLLKIEKFKQSVRKAVLCSPAACVDMRDGPTLVLDGLRDYLASIFDFKSFPHMNPSIPTTVNKTDLERELMLKTHHALRDQVLQKYPWWEDISLDEGEIFVVSAISDRVTQSKRALKEIRGSNPDLKIREVVGTHTLAITKPEEVLKIINQDSQ